MSAVQLELQIATGQPDLPGKREIERWIEVTLAAVRPSLAEQENNAVTVRLVGVDEIRALNQTYRHRDGATNVLSFPFERIAGIEEALLGDLVVCADIVAMEAVKQHKSLRAHWAHLIVHGTLHLCGYDHIENEQAETMEALEVRIMRELGFGNPYIMDQPS